MILFVIQIAFGLPIDDSACDCGNFLHSSIHFVFCLYDKPAKKIVPLRMWIYVLFCYDKVHFRVENELVSAKNYKIQTHNSCFGIENWIR